MDRSRWRRGLTWLDVLVAVIVLALLSGVLLLVTGHKTRQTSFSMHDSYQVRGIHQGFVFWSQNNQGRYPLPSLLDTDGNTLPGDADEKDTTANIISLLIFQGFFSPEICVSPQEYNSAIRIFDKYQYTEPAGTADPKKALWDPAFPVDFTSGKGGLSYAHAVLWGERKDRWKQAFSATTPILGNRGPQIAGVAKGKSPDVTPTLVNPKSNTLLIHGGRTTWEGNIAYDDNHVNFETTLAPEGVVYKDAEKKEWRDTLFFDEPDDPSNLNAMLGITVKSGKSKEDHKLIWD